MYVFDLIVNESLIFHIVKLDMRFFFLKKNKNKDGKTSLVTTLVT